MFKKITLLSCLISSCLSFAAETPQDQKTKELFTKGQQLIAGGTDGLVNQAESYVNGQGVGVAKSFLQKYFPTVELQVDMFDTKKTTSGILIVVPLSDPKDIKNTFFMT